MTYPCLTLFLSFTIILFLRQFKLVRAAPPLAGPGSGEQVGVCLDVEGGRGGAGHREVADQHQPALNCQDF